MQKMNLESLIVVAGCSVAALLGGCATDHGIGDLLTWTVQTGESRPPADEPQMPIPRIATVSVKDQDGLLLLTVTYDRDLNDYCGYTSRNGRKYGAHLADFYFDLDGDTNTWEKPFPSSKETVPALNYDAWAYLHLDEWYISDMAELCQGDEVNAHAALGGNVWCGFQRLLNHNTSSQFAGELLLRQRRLGWHDLVKWEGRVVQIRIPHWFAGIRPGNRITMYYGEMKDIGEPLSGFRAEYSEPKTLTIRSSGTGMSGVGHKPSRWESFIAAAGSGQSRFVRSEVEAGIARPVWDAAIVSAADGGHSDLLRYFLDKGVANDRMEHLLYRTARGGHYEAAKFLVTRGAKFKEGRAEDNAALVAAVALGDTRLARLLLDAGDDVNAAHYCRGTPLLKAVLGRNSDMAKLLLAKGADPNAGPETAWTPTGRTPLFFAVEKGDRHLVEILLKAGADPHVKDGEGVSPVQLAKQLKHDSILRVLEAIRR